VSLGVGVGVGLEGQSEVFPSSLSQSFQDKETDEKDRIEREQTAKGKTLETKERQKKDKRKTKAKRERQKKDKRQASKQRQRHRQTQRQNKTRQGKTQRHLIRRIDVQITFVPN
jgi:hypothetical protein